jgi:hypothetical protein
MSALTALTALTGVSPVAGLCIVSVSCTLGAMTALPSFMQGSTPKTSRRHLREHETWAPEVRAMINDMVDYMIETGQYFTSAEVARKVNTAIDSQKLDSAKVSRNGAVNFIALTRDIQWSQIGKRV